MKLTFDKRTGKHLTAIDWERVSTIVNLNAAVSQPTNKATVQGLPVKTIKEAVNRAQANCINTEYRLYLMDLQTYFDAICKVRDVRDAIIKTLK